MGLFDEEQIPSWFASLYSEFLQSYPKSNLEWALRQDKKYWWNLKFYRPQAIELAMKRAASKYSNFPTPQSVVEFLPEGSRLDRASHEHVETVRSVTLSPKTQAQSRLEREMLSKEKALVGRSVELPWEQYEEERRRHSEWYRDVFWPAYVEAGKTPDLPMTQEERTRIHEHFQAWKATFSGLAQKMDITPDGGKTEWNPKEEPPRTEKTYFEYRDGIKDNEIPF